MRLVNKKESWNVFAVRLAIVTFVVAVSVYLFFGSYRFGVDAQAYKCLPYTLFLVQREPRHESPADLEKGRIYTFESRGLEPSISDGTRMVKILAAMPGDRVKVTPDGGVYINDERFTEGDLYARLNGIPMEHFAGEATLRDDQFWFLGTEQESFDSRYWGVVTYDQIQGRAHPIF